MAKKTIPRTCEQCGGEFFPLLKEVNRGGGRFCKMACWARYVTRTRKPPKQRTPDYGPNKKRCPKCDTVKDFSEFGRCEGRRHNLSGHCKPCMSKRTAKWGRDNKDKKLATGKKWVAANPEKRRATHETHKQKMMRLAASATPPIEKTCTKCGETKPFDQFRPTKKSPDGRAWECNACFGIRKQAWRGTRREEERAQGRRQYEINPARFRSKARRYRITKLGLPGNHTDAEWNDLCQRFDHRCVRCGKREEMVRDHIVPVTRPGSSDSISNIQPLCRACNAGKCNRHSTDYRDTPFTGTGRELSGLPDGGSPDKLQSQYDGYHLGVAAVAS